MPYYSPLRYPGGKRKLASFIELLIEDNSYSDHVFVEPYAGGAAVALHMLLETRVPTVIINDFDPAIYAFWSAVKEEPEELCRRISSVPVNIEEWKRQKKVQTAEDPERIDLALSTFFLNRTNRSGILKAGVIGGKEQSGKWKMTARFNRSSLIDRIEKIAGEADRLEVSGSDAANLLTRLPTEESSLFLFMDPPYYHKADRRLYRNEYVPQDHADVAELLKAMSTPWLLTYDDCSEVRELYSWACPLSFGLSYTAGRKRTAEEVMFYAPCVDLPNPNEHDAAWWVN